MKINEAWEKIRSALPPDISEFHFQYGRMLFLGGIAAAIAAVTDDMGGTYENIDEVQKELNEELAKAQVDWDWLREELKRKGEL